MHRTAKQPFKGRGGERRCKYFLTTIFQREFAAKFSYPSLNWPLSTQVLNTRILQLWKLVNNPRVRSLRHWICKCGVRPAQRILQERAGILFFHPGLIDIMQRKSHPTLLMEVLSFVVFSASTNSCTVQLHLSISYKSIHFRREEEKWKRRGKNSLVVISVL